MLINIYDNIYSQARKVKFQANTALHELQRQTNVETPKLKTVMEALKPIAELATSISQQLSPDAIDPSAKPAYRLALALNKEHRTHHEIYLTHCSISLTGLNDKSGLIILEPLLETLNTLFTLKIDLTKKFPNDLGNPYPYPDLVRQSIESAVNTTRTAITVILRELNQATKKSLLETINADYGYGAAMHRELGFFSKRLL